MARTLGRLKDVTVRRRTLAAGYYADGGGLYLRVSASGSKSWVFRYERDARRRELGLGATHAVTLAAARERAAECRALLAEGKDPFHERRAARAAERGVVTFGEAADRYIAAYAPGWRNAKHAAQWTSTLATYAAPVLGTLPVAAVDTGAVMRVLEPLWQEKTETASRLRGRIESVLDYATARGWRTGENPARWRGHMQKLLPARAKVQRVEHHPALPYADMPAFMAGLRKQEGTAALALRFCILTAARTGEVTGARWPEIVDNLWIIPASRIKAGREHRVPLSPAAMAILTEMQPLAAGGDAHVFPGGKPKAGLSNAAMSAVLDRMGRDGITVHGFRSTFRDWAAECTSFPNEVVEMALAHVVKDRTEAAYRRGDLLEKRAKLMQAWAAYCTGGGKRQRAAG